MENDPSLARGYDLAVLTPNVNEYTRLCKNILNKTPNEDNPEETVAELARSLGNVTVIRKGARDIISNGHCGTLLFHTKILSSD